MESPPSSFSRTVPVPGLVDMAAPPFDTPAPKVADREQLPSKDPLRDAYWYRREFTLKGPIPEVATLKISKAMFGSRAILNGILLGDHRPSYTPAYFDVRDALRVGDNELIIRVGADREAVTTAHPSGFDFEKERYIPGIFDEVGLILSGTPHIVNVQTSPDLTNQTVRVQTELKNTGATTLVKLNFEVREYASGDCVGQVEIDMGPMQTGSDAIFYTQVPIAACRLWSPEDPFLYTLTVENSTDRVETRFGMREFRFNPVTRFAELNGKPYFMRGSNITLYRFFEDPDRGNLPWDENWVRELHRKARDMHWNCLRYCIGFPPEAWYRIADEEGLLIQDEFPIWFGGEDWSTWPEDLKRDQIAIEFEEWMRERWNHPCVVIWDASNETANPETGPAIKAVRELDLSNRPWDNGFVYPQEPGDVYESHPYHFMDSNFKLHQLAEAKRVPKGNETPNDKKHAVIINEYGWLWLNRDGSPTTLTKDLYMNLMGPDATAEQRQALYGRYLAAETEFWRVHRKVAGLMHFTLLGYSRPDGQTSDHWTDLVKQVWEPNFYRYVRDAFAPLGLCVKFWDETLPVDEMHVFTVTLINDLETPWSGPVTLSLLQSDTVVVQAQQDAHVEPYGLCDVSLEITTPAETGTYMLVAEIRDADDDPVRSVREVSCMLYTPIPPYL